MTVLLAVIAVFALLALLLAVQQAMAMIRLAPAGSQLATFMPLGWWKFAQLRRRVGDTAAAPLAIYQRAVIAFVVFVVVGLVLSGWMINRPAASLQAAQNGVSQPQPVAFFLSSPDRRAASMPGAALES